MSDKKSNKILKGSVIIFLGNVLGMGAGFLFRIFTARSLTPQEYGVIVLGITIVNITSLISLIGIQTGIAREISNTKSVKTLINSSLFFIVPISILMTLVSIFIIYLSSMANSTKTVLVIFSVGIPARTVLKYCVGVYRGQELMHYKVLVQDFVYQFLILFLIYILIFYNYSIEALAIGWVSAVTLSSLIGLAFIQNKVKLFDVEYFDKGTIRSLILFSAPLLIANVVWVVMKQLDTIMLGMFDTLENIGIYDASFTVSRIFLLVVSTVGFVLLPAITRLKNENEINKIKDIYQRGTKWMFIISFPIYIIILQFPHVILNTVFGTGYLKGGMVLQIVSSAFMIHIILGVNSNVLIAFGNTKKIMLGNLLAFCVNVLLNLVLIPVIGIAGAAIALLTSYTVSNLYWAYTLYRLKKIQPFNRNYVAMLTIGLAIILFLSFIGNLPFYLGTFIASIIIFLYLSCVLFIGMDKVDKEELKYISTKIVRNIV